MLDKDYLDYLQMMGKETKDPQYIWMYLSVITSYLAGKELPKEDKVVNLVGQYKINSQGGGGYPKGPPQSVLN